MGESEERKCEKRVRVRRSRRSVREKQDYGVRK